jgi:hypothetical protein
LFSFALWPPGFEDMQSRFDVTAQLKTFERKFQRLEEALHIKL